MKVRSEDDIFDHCEEGDPNACQAVLRDGRKCVNRAVPDSRFCAIHGANAELAAKERKRIFNYNLTKFRARVQDFAINPALKNLHEEVGILRLMLESLINRCQDDHELMLASTQISNLVCNIEKLVSSANKLDLNLGQLLDRNKAVQLADEIVQIIVDEIDDEDAIARVATKITATMNRITISE